MSDILSPSQQATYIPWGDYTNLYQYLISNESHINKIDTFNVAWFFSANIYFIAFALIKTNSFGWIKYNILV